MRHTTILIFFCFVLFITMVFAQIPPAIGYSQAQGNDGVLQLRVIYESDAIAAGNGVVKIVLPDGTVGCADLVDTNNVDASEIRVCTTYGTRAWRIGYLDLDSLLCFAIGGGSVEYGFSLIQTCDGGYAFAGATLSYGAGNLDLLLVKLNNSFSIEWTKVIGGSSYDVAHQVVQAHDSSYFVIGDGASYGAGRNDIILIKLDYSGSFLWAKTIGGSETEYGRSIYKTSDGGLVIAGYSNSFGSGVFDFDFVVLKIDNSGFLEWARKIGGLGKDECFSIIQTFDSGYAIVGQTDSYGSGEDDLLIVKLSNTGDLEWARAVGGTDDDWGYGIIQTADGSLITAGYTWSYGQGGSDLFLVKFSVSGSLEWSCAVGSSEDDYGGSLVETSDGGFAVAGAIKGFGIGDADMFLAKFSDSCIFEWGSISGGSEIDYGVSVIENLVSELVLAGYTYSFGEGENDMFVTKFSQIGQTCCGSYVSPTITYLTPTIMDVTPAVSNVSPTVMDVTPTITDVTPTQTWICPE